MNRNFAVKLFGGFAPIIFALVSLALIFANRSSVVYGTPLLATLLYIVFVGINYLLVSFISTRAYVQSGNVSFLLLGSSLVVAGCSALLTFSLSSAPNYSATVADLGFFFSAMLNLVSALCVYTGVGESPAKSKKSRSVAIPAAVYSALALLSALIAVLALKGLTPVLFVQGVGGTLLRQEVVAASAILFGISSLVFLKMSFETHSDIMFWYSGGLAMLALCFFSVFFLNVVGGELSWIGRIAQYLSGIYFLMLVLTSTKERPEASNTRSPEMPDQVTPHTVQRDSSSLSSVQLERSSSELTELETS